MNFYNLKYKTASGQIHSMSEFKGKPILVVNTATKCGFAPQFKGLEELHQEFKEQGLVVIGFPCNQFQNQEPETNESMVESCELNFGVTFQLTEKINVNGDETHEVFKILKAELKGLLGQKITWNFTKFLIDGEGNPIKRYAPTTKPEKIRKDIVDILKN